MNVHQAIVSGIRERLFEHDYLAIPGFGGFVLRVQPAHFTGGGSVLVPAAKTLSFNSQLRQDDGLLVSWLEERLHCTKAQAHAHLQEFASYCTSVLAAKRRLNLLQIGFFFLDFENNLRFEPLAEENFHTGSFGLAPISLPAVQQESPPRRKAETFVDRPAPTASVSRSGRRVARYVVPLAAIALVISGLSLLISGMRMNGQLSASLFGFSPTATYVPMPYPDLSLRTALTPEPLVMDANGIAILETDGISIPVRLVETDMKPATRSAVARKSGHFEIVLGCFASKTNAERFVQRLSSNGLTAGLSARNQRGLFVVIGGSFDSHSAAASNLEAVKKTVSSAWVRRP